ncbi:caspase family protein [Leptolyngbya sp. PL-A3]|uniref:nSTAND1 domain-containing NTPase n=1 Tax=Leptolyngbya sp. PL-A3 TaxID=2933911 RepID=UPI003297C111
MSGFSGNLAIVIGINQYDYGIAPLQNAVNDAKQLVKILREKHNYRVWVCLDEDATLKNLEHLLEKTLPENVGQDDRLLFYFAGHGIALSGDDDPAGYLIPQDARQGEVQTYLPMTRLQAALEKLPCRHFLGILDCCFAGAFRWGSTRDLLAAPEVIHRERYDRFIQDPAWQIITSAASDQKALDALSLNAERSQVGEHSPFAAALFEALSGDADRYPPATPGKRPGDGVVTATELYLYLRDRIEPATESYRQRQTPGIWSLKKHDKGEYVFLTPGHPLNLPPAPPLDESKNPYRGLESFETEHKDLFFGRTAIVEQLAEFVTSHPLTVVLGASGSGKSSLVKAGLIPKLEATDWVKIVIRPGKSAYAALNIALDQEAVAQKSYVELISNWKQENPHTKILLVIDQCEELITLCHNEQESRQFLEELEQVITTHSDTIKVILTLRSDFEPQLRDLALKEWWQSARFIVPAMSRSQLRNAIEKPAEARVMYFQPHDLVEKLIDEVADMPGALPLLSFALSELYLNYLKRQREANLRGETLDRAVTQADYDKLGGVTRSLTQRADQECNALGEAYEQTIKIVMLRMVAVGSGELARRRVSWTELSYSPARAGQVKQVIEKFSAARLLVEGQDAEGNSYVEPAHDALILGWAKLRDWAKAEKNLELQRRLTPAAFEWKTKQQNRFLWNADPYLEVLQKEVFNSSKQNWLNQVETEFVQRSAQQKQRNVRTRWGIAIAVMLGLSGLAIAAWFGQRDAKIGQMQAASQASEALLQTKQLTIDAALDSLHAAKLLKELQQGFFPIPINEQTAIVRNLRKAVYTVREMNRLEGFSGRVAKVFWKDDRLLVVTIEQAGTVHIWDSQNRQEVNKLDRPPGSTTDVELSPDGNLLAIAGGEGGTISLWGWQQQQVTAELPVDENITRLRFSLDSRQLAVVGYRSTDTGVSNIFYHWDLATNAYSQVTQPNLLDVGFDTQGQLLQAIAKEDGTLQILNASNQLLQQFNSGVSHAPLDAVFNLNGSRIFINQKRNDGQGLEEGAIVRDLNTDEVTALGQDFTFAFSAKGSILATTGAADGTVRLRTGSGEPIEFKAHQTQVANLDFREDGSQLATASADGTVRIWSVEPQPLTFLQQLPGSFQSVAFQPGRNRIIGQSPDGILHWFNAKGELTEQSQASLPLFNEMSFSPDGQRLVALAQDGTLYSLTPDGTVLNPFEGNYSPSSVYPPSNVAFSPEGGQVAVIAGEESERTINILDVTSGRIVNRFRQTQPTKFDQVIWQPDSNRILYASLTVVEDGVRDNSVRLWDVASERQYATPLTAYQRNGFSSLTFNQDGSLMAIAENDRIILTYLDGTTMAEFSTDSGGIKSLKLSSDGAFLLSIGEDGTTKLWQIGELDQLIEQGCNRLRNYLTQMNVSERDRQLCKD